VATGLTQTEVARRLGKPRSFVSKSESGERRDDAVEFVHFARIYEQRMDPCFKPDRRRR